MQRKQERIIDGTKYYKCKHCNRWLDKSKYHKDLSRWNKLFPKCKDCRK